MPTFASPVDNASLFYRHYRPDATGFRARDVPVSDVTLVFLHGYPFSSRMWEHLLVPLSETHRIPVVAVDRRGFGKSEWNTAATTKSLSWDVLVADLVGLLESLDLKKIVVVAHSMGGPESVLAYLGSSYLQERTLVSLLLFPRAFRGFVWVAAAMPYPLKSDEHPLSQPREYWEQILDGFRALGPDFLPLAIPGLFALQAGNEVPPKTLDFYSNLVFEADRAALEKMASVIQEDTGAQVKQLAASASSVPILMVHGDSDGNTPLESSSQVLKELLPWAQLEVYEKGGHLLTATHSQQLLTDLLAFVEPLAGRSA
ncbi:alpha/beta-hydrolase [Thozetella sp. PMI_491]|nr:alpha/beta-hydrolase [Thozetella sp. PMI_491]